MITAESDQSETKLERFRVRFRDGHIWTVLAATFRRRLTPEDEVVFYDERDAENQHMFFRASDVSAIAPDSEFDIEPPFLVLQNEVKNLTARMNSLESNLADIVVRAVGEAFAQRGL